MSKTPSDEIVSNAAKEIEVVDAKGRKITLKKPGVLSQYRLVEMLGSLASNQTYVGMVLPLIYISAIDGVKVLQPVSKREMEALIERLDDDGIEAVSNSVAENFGKQNPEADKEKLKK